MGWNLRTHTHTQKLSQTNWSCPSVINNLRSAQEGNCSKKLFPNWPLGWSWLPLLSCEWQQPLLVGTPPPASAALLPAHSVPPGRLSGRTRGAQPTTNQQIQPTNATNTNKNCTNTINKCYKHNQQLQQRQPTTPTNTTNKRNKYNQKILNYFNAQNRHYQMLSNSNAQ